MANDKKKKTKSYAAKKKSAEKLSMTVFTGMPARKFAKLRYVDQVTIDAADGGKLAHVFRANDLYDPNYTTTGHQCYGFDQLMAYYDHFTVIGSSMVAEFVPKTAANLIPAYAGITLSDNGSRVASATNVNHLLESKYSSGSKLIGSYFPSKPSKLYKKFSAKKFFGVADVLGSSIFRGSATGTPDEMAWYELWTAAVGTTGNDPPAMDFKVTIDYIACFTEPKQIAQS